jgi:hypothetical protein
MGLSLTVPAAVGADTCSRLTHFLQTISYLCPRMPELSKLRVRYADMRRTDISGKTISLEISSFAGMYF